MIAILMVKMLLPLAAMLLLLLLIMLMLTIMSATCHGDDDDHDENEHSNSSCFCHRPDFLYPRRCPHFPGLNLPPETSSSFWVLVQRRDSQTVLQVA